MDTPEKIARELLTVDDAKFTDARVIQGALAIAAYGEQCRRAGAEAMREAAANIAAQWGEGDASEHIGALPLPSVAEAASPAPETGARIADNITRALRTVWDIPAGADLSWLGNAIADDLPARPEAASPAAGWQSTEAKGVTVVRSTDSHAATVKSLIDFTSQLWPKDDTHLLQISIELVTLYPAPSEEARAG